jgi:hypothetical protein
MSLQLRLPRGPITVQPGSTVRVRIAVTNAGLRTEQLAPTVLGGAASWTTLWPPSLSVAPGGEGVVEAELHPPRVAHVRAGPMPFGVQVASLTGPSVAIAEQVLVVETFSDLSGELAPAVVTGRSGTTWLRLHNRGNAARSVMIAARDGEGGLRFDCRPGGLTLYPGTTGTVRVRLRASPGLRRGAPLHRTFEVLVRAADADPLALRGTSIVHAWYPFAVRQPQVVN